MARMHSRKKGKSKSSKPVKKQVPSWMRYKPAEVELLIAKLAKDGVSSSKIGLAMRDTYGIPDVKSLCGKSISAILTKRKLSPELPDDLIALIRKYAAIKKHLEENHHDQTAKRGFQLTESKIKRLVKYYKTTGKIAEDWKFDVSRVGFFLE